LAHRLTYAKLQLMKVFRLGILSLLIPFAVSAQTATWQSSGLSGGGALFSPSINPHNTADVFVACDMSALYETTNFGGSWNMHSFKTIQANRSTKVCFTSNPQIIYTIDHTPDAGSDAARPVKSPDGGQTWQYLTDPTGSDCWSLWADYNNPLRIIISDYSQVWLSSDGGAHFTSEFITNINGNGCHIAGVFFEGTTIYIGTNAGLYISTNDGGTFTLAPLTGVNSGESMVSFCGAKQGNTTHLYCITQNTGDVYAGIAGDSYDGFMNIYSMNPAAAIWYMASSGIPPGFKPFFIKCADNDVNTVYCGGSDSNNGVPAVCKSINGAATWSQVLFPTQNDNIYTGWCGDGGDRGWGYAELIFGMDVSPLDASRVAFTDYGFIHLTSDGGITWKQGYVDPAFQNPPGANTPSFKNYKGNGLENTSCWNLCWGSSQKIFAGYSDIRGTESSDDGNTWKITSATSQNTVYRFLKHPSNGNIYAATSTAHDIYQTTYLTDSRLDVAFGGITYSSDNGNTWQTLHNFNHPVVWICMDPANSNTMYAGVIHYAGGVGEGGIWRTDNLNAGGGSVWTKLSNPPRTEGHPFNIHVLNDGSVVASYCGRRNASGTFTASSGVYILPAGSSTWSDRSDAAMMYYTKDVIIDPNDVSQSTWYACVWSGWGGAPNGLGGLYKTINRGVTWTRIFSSADRVSSVTINPADAAEAWMTTETDGLWHCTDFNTTATFVQETTFPFRQPERVFYNPYNNSEIWITSFGGGIMKGSVVTAVLNLKGENKFSICPNPSANRINLYIDNEAELQIRDMNGRLCFEKILESGRQSVNTSLQKGIYIASVTGEKRTSACKLVIY
jgi:photosystem II stability/assembly factor-like uncharacterized protein